MIKYDDQEFKNIYICYAGPVLWNSLPYSVKSKDNIEIFKKDIKTFLFKKILVNVM